MGINMRTSSPHEVMVMIKHFCKELGKMPGFMRSDQKVFTSLLKSPSHSFLPLHYSHAMYIQSIVHEGVKHVMCILKSTSIHRVPSVRVTHASWEVFRKDNPHFRRSFPSPLVDKEPVPKKKQRAGQD